MSLTGAIFASSGRSLRSASLSNKRICSRCPTDFDTSYFDIRHVSWDGYIEVGGNRYSVPESLCGHPVSIRISLDDGAGAPCSAVATGQSG